LATVTLITDFGAHDASAGMTKGVLLSALPDIRIIDVSHEIQPFRKDMASYVLRSSYQHFAPGTVHLVLVDVYHETVPRLVYAYHDGHYFIAPDNGILPAALVADAFDGRLSFELQAGNSFADWLSAAARCISMISDGVVDQLPSIRLSVMETAEKKNEETQGEYDVEVQYVDHFGNAVTNLHRGYLEKMSPGNRFRLDIMHVTELNTISESYTDVPPGELLCRFNRNGLLEICVNQGSAASLFGLRTGGQNNYLKIRFE
jgi:S-adenosylmethionine hydrolase